MSFDSVVTKCPKCGAEIEFQSKALNCDFETYNLECVPVEIANDINGEEQICKNCDSKVIINCLHIVRSVPMYIRIAVKFDQEEK